MVYSIYSIYCTRCRDHLNSSEIYFACGDDKKFVYFDGFDALKDVMIIQEHWISLSYFLCEHTHYFQSIEIEIL